MINEYGAIGMRIGTGTEILGKKTSNAPFSTTNTCPDPGLNPDHRNEKLATVVRRLVNIMTVLS
jgi:hypothetical protein